ncbi:hypothetical protein AB0B31_17485 [Catellatospora citrea]|uniref:hypothetical protein n=1 Tax=Catellatospora citrea TaxID=53366 RepID=UPI0033FCEC87
MSEPTPNPYDAGGPLPAEPGFRPPDEAYREAVPDDAMAVAVAGGATLLTAVIEIPLTTVMFSGILITYAERRGAEGPASTRQLVEELAR